MSTEKLNTEIRQEQIARAALSLVSSQGLKKLNVASVARRVGIVPSAIYRHFQNKDEILDSVLNLIHDLLHTNVSKARKEAGDPLEQLHRLLNLHVRLIRENEGIPRIIFSQDVYSSHPERKAKVCQTIMQYLHEVGEIVRQGQAGGQIKRDLDPETISMMFLGLIQPAAIVWHLSEGSFDVTKHAERAWKIFRGAIGKE